MTQAPAGDTRTIDERIGERVHQMMFRKRLSQTAVAPALGIGQAALSKKLRGQNGWSAEDIFRVAQVLDTSPNELLEWAPWGSNPQPTDYVDSQAGATVHRLPGTLIDLAAARERRAS